jgi:hypothetical protein
MYLIDAQLWATQYTDVCLNFAEVTLEFELLKEVNKEINRYILVN